MTSAGGRPIPSAIAAVQRLINHFDNNGLIIGGIALGLVAEPRYTADVDAMLLAPDDDVAAVIAAAAQEGISTRIADAEAFARRNRVLLLRHDDTGIDIDVSLGLLPFEIEAIERGLVMRVGNRRVRVPTPEDLIIMKAVARRPQDILDIQTIVRSNPGIDRERIRFWVEAFAEALEQPDLWDIIAPLL